MWPVFDPVLAQDDKITIIVQVNGKVRATLVVEKDALQETIEPLARAAIEKWLVDKTVRKTIFVKNRLINFVVA